MKDRAEQMREAAAEKAKAFTSKSLEMTVTRRDGSEVKRFDVHQVLREVRYVAATIEADIRAIPLPPQSPLDVEVAGVVEVFAFLRGEGPLEGVWFGDDHPTEKGKFWWRKHLRSAADLIEQLARERDFLLTCGIIELAVRNPNVNSYVQEWEARAEKAEAENARLREDGQIAMMAGHDMAKEDYKDTIAELEAEVARLRKVIFGSMSLAESIYDEGMAALEPKGADHG